MTMLGDPALDRLDGTSADRGAAVGHPVAVARPYAWRRFGRNRLALAAGVLLLAIVTAALLAPWIAPYDPFAGSLRFRSRPPGAAFWFGTDEQGRDILSRVLFGTRLTLLTGVASLLVGGTIGCLLGVLAAFYARLDDVIMRLNDVILSFPAILVGFSVAGMMGPGLATIVLALSVATVPPIARIARSAASVIVHREFVMAGRSLGLTDAALIWRYVLANCASEIGVFATLWFGQVVLLGSALSFLGLGPSPPVADLGTMASQGRSQLMLAPHVSLIPCGAILVLVLSINLLGDALRDVADPRSRS